MSKSRRAESRGSFGLDTGGTPATDTYIQIGGGDIQTVAHRLQEDVDRMGIVAFDHALTRLAPSNAFRSTLNSMKSCPLTGLRCELRDITSANDSESRFYLTAPRSSAPVRPESSFALLCINFQ
jgi:hypothetical protein